MLWQVLFIFIRSIQIGKSVGEPGTAVFWVLVFMAVLLAVFVPKYGYDRFLLRAKYRTQGNYILAFEQSLEGKPYLFKDKAFYSRNRTIFQNEVWNVVNESFDFFLDGTLLLLNICFNVAVIDPLFRNQGTDIFSPRGLPDAYYAL